MGLINPICILNRYNIFLHTIRLWQQSAEPRGQVPQWNMTVSIQNIESMLVNFWTHFCVVLPSAPFQTCDSHFAI